MELNENMNEVLDDNKKHYTLNRAKAMLERQDMIQYMLQNKLMTDNDKNIINAIAIKQYRAIDQQDVNNLQAIKTRLRWDEMTTTNAAYLASIRTFNNINDSRLKTLFQEDKDRMLAIYEKYKDNRLQFVDPVDRSFVDAIREYKKTYGNVTQNKQYLVSTQKNTIHPAPTQKNTIHPAPTKKIKSCFAPTQKNTIHPVPMQRKVKVIMKDDEVIDERYEKEEQNIIKPYYVPTQKPKLYFAPMQRGVRVIMKDDEVIDKRYEKEEQNIKNNKLLLKHKRRESSKSPE